MRILTIFVFILLTVRVGLWGATPVASTLVLAGSEGVQLSWNVIPGRTYLIQSTTNLSAPWHRFICLHSAKGTGGSHCLFPGVAKSQATLAGVEKKATYHSRLHSCVIHRPQ